MEQTKVMAQSIPSVTIPQSLVILLVLNFSTRGNFTFLLFKLNSCLFYLISCKFLSKERSDQFKKHVLLFY